MQTVDLADVAEDSASTTLKLISVNKLINQFISEKSKGKFHSLKEGILLWQVKVVSKKGDRAKILVTPPLGKEEVEITKLEGKWMPSKSICEYTRDMPQVKEEMGKQLDKIAKNELMIRAGLATASVIISSLEKAKTSEGVKKTFDSLQINPMALMTNLGALSNSRYKKESTELSSTRVTIHSVNHNSLKSRLYTALKVGNRAIYISRIPLLSDAEISYAEPMMYRGGQYELKLTLTFKGMLRWQQLMG